MVFRRTHAHTKHDGPHHHAPFQSPLIRDQTYSKTTDAKGPRVSLGPCRSALLPRQCRVLPNEAREPTMHGGDSTAAGGRWGQCLGQQGPASRGPVGCRVPDGRGGRRPWCAGRAPQSRFILRGVRPSAGMQPQKGSPTCFYLVGNVSRHSLHSGLRAQMDAQSDDFRQVHRGHRRCGSGLARVHHTLKGVTLLTASPSAVVSCCGYVTNRHTHSGFRQRPTVTSDGWRAWLVLSAILPGRGQGADGDARLLQAPTSRAPTSRAPASRAVPG